MNNTQFKGEGDDEAITKQENYSPFPGTEIALRQQKWNGNAQVLLNTVQPIFT